MLRALTLLLICQLLGEAIAVLANWPIPGPVLGLAFLLAGLLILRRSPDWLQDTSAGLLKHLSLLFVPASVGLVQHADRLKVEWLPLAAGVIVSTVAAIAVGAVVFVAVSRLIGAPAEGEDRKA
ncbi:CidA/LrgA family protein [Pacificispira sp.]|uniref:CidA/LrgA family protein n=1 Tax=Pacificispira sp. TaxID=2888761 RepID=UPI003BAD3437